MLPDRLGVAKPIEVTKNDHGRDFTAMPAMLATPTLAPANLAMAIRIRSPDRTISNGVRIAQANPMTACLYRMVRSRRVSWNRRSRVSQRSRKMTRRSPIADFLGITGGAGRTGGADTAPPSASIMGFCTGLDGV